MKVSLTWLKNYVKTTLTPLEISKGLTDLGLECTYEQHGISFSNIVVGKVVKCEPHQDSTHLSVCVVQTGDKSLYTVVCGASNVKVGILVPFAKVGATLDYEKFKIKKTKLRGVVSEGMICSEKELGIGPDHEGIMILDKDYETGSDFSKIINLEDDIIYDIDLTPNRGDCLGHIGVARELAILEKNNSSKINYNFNVSISNFKKAKSDKTKEALTIKISDNNKCKRYVACIIRNVKVQTSPDWLKRSLESIGQKSVNNIVDAANFILMDLGHPMHTFDLDKINSRNIDVRTARKNETIITLDGCKQKLNTNHLLICDGNNPVAIAGIIGGNNSEIDEKTKNILIESAYFEPVNIRKTSKEIGISTEASKRFERGTDINILLPALNKLCILIQDISGGEVSSKYFDIYPDKFETKKIKFNLDDCNQFLGSNLTLDVVKNIFETLSISCKTNAKALICTIPSFRNDLDREVDLYEEIARVFGYNNINNSKTCSMLFSGFVQDQREIDSYARAFLSSNGFNEHYSNSLLNKDESNLIDNNTSIKISNPLNSDMEYLRNSLFSGLMKAVKFNESRQEKLFKLFEIGAVHSNSEFTNTKTIEFFHIGLVWYGDNIEYWQNNEIIDFYYAKSELVHLLESLGIYDIEFKKEIIADGFEILYEIYSLKNNLGIIGIPNIDNRNFFSISGNCIFCELNINSINNIVNKKDKKILSSNYFPYISRDISILVSNKIEFIDIYNSIISINKTILKNVDIFDLYKDDKIEKNKKSMSFRIKFQSIEKTLKDEEVDIIIDQIINKLKNKFNAIQR